MIKDNKIYILAVALLLILLLGLGYYINFINTQKKLFKDQHYALVAKEMQKRASDMILSKEKSIVAIGLSLAKDKNIIKFLKNKNIPDYYYKNVIDEYKKHTLYKNIWIEVIDKDLNSLYRSWSKDKDDNLKDLRKDLVKVIQTKDVLFGVSSGKYTLSLRAMVPIIDDGKLIGVLEVIAHFNSISKQMKKFGVESVVLLSKKMSKELTEPFTKMYVDGYYVANFDANRKLLKHIERLGVDSFLKAPYQLDENYLVSLLPLTCVHDKLVGYYLMFIKKNEISTLDVDFLSFKLLVSGIIFVLLLLGAFSMIVLYYIRKQKLYYKAIVDSTTNIVLINDKKRILDVNNEFFYYFKEFENLEDFRVKHQCICDFFVEEEGYLQKIMDGKYWTDYLLEHKGRSAIVKLRVEENIFYFSVNAAKIFTRFSTVFTDITEQENFKRELEKLTITDPLTGIGNRRYYEHKIEEEIQRMSRFKYDVSLVMFDIDHFKKVNDIHGHTIGDEVLKKYTALIRSELRSSDVFCRVGGEEFVIILPHTNLNNAGIIAEKIRARVEEHQTKVSITMSFGVVQIKEDEDSSLLYKRVDKLLYKAKESGRNKVVVG